MRVVVAGCGRMSRNFLAAAKQVPEVDIVALVDPDLSRAEERRSEFAPDAATDTGLERLLQRLSPDAVFDIVVPAARHEVARTALRHGCHILTEKPMADTMANARDLVVRAREAGRIHAVVQNRRYLEGVRRIARFLRSGALGRVTGLYCDFFLGPHFGGFREEMEHVLLLDMAIHTFDVGRLFAGCEPVSVQCREWNPPNSWYAHGASAIATFDMADGAVFSYRGSWCAEGLRTSWESTWRIIGSRGTLLWDGADDIRAEIVAGQGFFSETHSAEIPPLDPSDRIGGHLGVIADFVSAVATGRDPETVGHENIRSLGMVFGAIESAKTGRSVHLQRGEM
jgi:predicted dehydrogenase